MKRLSKLFLVFLGLAVFLWLLLLAACSLPFTFPPYLLASIVFPADGLQVGSDRVMAFWRAEYRPLQVLVNTGTGLRTEAADYVLYLDDRPVASGRGSYGSLFLADLNPGPHTLRLEARASGRSAFHEVRFFVDRGAAVPWRLEVIPYESVRRFVFDARGRLVTLPAEEPQRPMMVAHLDRRGLFELQGAFSNQPPRLFFRPWVWEQLGRPETLPLPSAGDGLLVGPGFWIADRLYAWEGDRWHPLPPLPVPQDLAEALALREGYSLENLARTYGAHLMWARRCEKTTWVYMTWIVPARGQSDYWPYLARLTEQGWELVPPPTPRGAYVLYCFGRFPYLVATAAADATLQPGQFVRWGGPLNAKDPEQFAEQQGLGHTYAWTGNGWTVVAAPPLVQWLDQQGGWVPTPYGPAPLWLEGGQYYVAVPGPSR